MKARLMSNHSAEYPNGILGKETLKSFFAITENPDGSLSYSPGTERIPDVWYRRPDDYNNLAPDLITIWTAAPKSLTVGGNTGTVNSFQGVDLSDLTGGAFRTRDLLDPAKASCFFYQLVLSAVPDFLRSQLLGTVLETALRLVSDNVAPLVDPACPRIGAFCRWQILGI